MLAYGPRMRRRRPHRLDKVTNSISAEGTAVLCFPPDGSFFRGLMTASNCKGPLSMDEDSPYVLYGRETPTPGQYQVTVADLETGLQYHVDKVQLRGELRGGRGRSSTSPEVPLHSTSDAIPISRGMGHRAGCFDDIFLEERSCPAHVDAHFLGARTPESDSIRLSSTPGTPPASGDDQGHNESPRDESLTPTSSAQFSLEYDHLEDSLQFTANAVHRGQKAEMIIQQLMAGSKLNGASSVVLVGPLRFSVSDTFSANTSMAWSM